MISGTPTNIELRITSLGTGLIAQPPSSLSTHLHISPKYYQLVHPLLGVGDPPYSYTLPRKVLKPAYTAPRSTHRIRLLARRLPLPDPIHEVLLSFPLCTTSIFGPQVIVIPVVSFYLVQLLPVCLAIGQRQTPRPASASASAPPPPHPQTSQALVLLAEQMAACVTGFSKRQIK